MNDATPTTPEPTDAAREATFSALFANLIMQQTNMALVFLGKLPHPEDQKATVDLDAAKMFIDTLEMLADKTRGNLAKIEHDLLQHSLTELRMHFVEAVDRVPAPAAPAAAAEPAPAAAPADTAAKPPAQPEAQEAAQPADDSRKKYVKKY
jgi:hypothetical protein